MRPLPRTARRARRSGFTLVELTVAMSVLGLGMMALTSTSLVVHSTQRMERERRLALEGLRQVSERLASRSASLTDAEPSWARAVTTAYAPDGDPGNTFTVRGLDLLPGQEAHGTITLVTDERTRDAELGVTLGMPRDLDGDGLALTPDVSAEARLIPAVIRVRWAGGNGPRELVHGIWLSER